MWLMSSLRAGLLGAVVLSTTACHPRSSRAPETRASLLVAATPSSPSRRAFYYWRSTLAFSAREAQALSTLHASRLYLRLFDVDWSDADAAPRPVAPLVVGHTAMGAPALPPNVEAVPVIFIRERVLSRLDPDASRRLAEDIWRNVEARMARVAGGTPTRELQIDCDWTESTRATYFALLDQLAKHAHRSGATLSATIRLHQIKYRERTGVPPVARGMLMFYNMGRIGPDPDSQAIFDPDRAADYLTRLSEYPLPLDVALPIWSWVRHVRGDRVVGLMQDTGLADLKNQQWLRPISARRFEVMETAFLDGVLLRRGDFLDTEDSTPSTTRAAAALLAPRLAAAAGGRTIALFHLSEKNLAHYETPDLAQVFASIP
jgi:hypothetical protein